jgi:sigma-B regulation protein RsbU (phosphoserine phosphatase)
MAVGYMEDSSFKQATLKLNAYNQLTVYSDGVYEVEKSNGDMVTLVEFTDIIKKFTNVKATHQDEILSTMRALQAVEGPFEDDFSLLQLNIHRI